MLSKFDEKIPVNFSKIWTQIHNKIPKYVGKYTKHSQEIVFFILDEMKIHNEDNSKIFDPMPKGEGKQRK